MGSLRTRSDDLPRAKTVTTAEILLEQARAHSSEIARLAELVEDEPVSPGRS